MSAPSQRSTWLLTWLILAGLIGGSLVGQWLHDPSFDPATQSDSEHAHASALYYLTFVGRTVFMGLLKMLIMPLIVSSVVVGVASVGDFRHLGRIGIKTLVYYVATMLIAVTVGLLLVNWIAPGEGLDLGAMRQQASAAYEARAQVIEANRPAGLIPAVLELLGRMIPTNPLAALADPSLKQILPVIFFSICFAVVLTTIGEKARVVVQFFQAVFEVMMKLVHIVIWLAPAGVFALLAWTVARIGFEVFAGALARYMGTVILGLAVHGLVILPAVLWLFGRAHPLKYASQMWQALMTAFGTDSSSATLPVTIECAVERGGCSRKAAGFVLPLGATINMDGTALYEAVAVAFLAQAHGIAVGWEASIIIALTATLAAVGAAGIPEAGLVTMVVVIGAVNGNILAHDPNAAVIPIAAVGLIIGVDRILDMCRTTVNVWGDAVGAKIISRTEPDELATPNH